MFTGWFTYVLLTFSAKDDNKMAQPCEYDDGDKEYEAEIESLNETNKR